MTPFNSPSYALWWWKDILKKLIEIKAHHLLEAAGLKGLQATGQFSSRPSCLYFLSLIPLPFPHLPLPPPEMTLPQARSHTISIGFRHKKLCPKHQNCPQQLPAAAQLCIVWV